jgi:hypothetical protein
MLNAPLKKIKQERVQSSNLYGTSGGSAKGWIFFGDTTRSATRRSQSGTPLCLLFPLLLFSNTWI